MAQQQEARITRAQEGHTQATGNILSAVALTAKNGNRYVAIEIASTTKDNGSFENGYCLKYAAKLWDERAVKMVEDDRLPVGRYITLAGHPSHIQTHYTDKKDGKVKQLKNPVTHLLDARIPYAGLGYMKPAQQEVSNQQEEPAGEQSEQMSWNAAPLVPDTEDIPF